MTTLTLSLCASGTGWETLNRMLWCPLSARLLVRIDSYLQSPSDTNCVASAQDWPIVVNVKLPCE